MEFSGTDLFLHFFGMGWPGCSNVCFLPAICNVVDQSHPNQDWISIDHYHDLGIFYGCCVQLRIKEPVWDSNKGEADEQEGSV